MIPATQAATAARAAIKQLLSHGAIRATKYLSETETVVAQRVTYDGKISKRDQRTTIVVTFGAPNYDAREFIKKCRKAGEPFPVNKIQLKFPTKAKL